MSPTFIVRLATLAALAHVAIVLAGCWAKAGPAAPGHLAAGRYHLATRAEIRAIGKSVAEGALPAAEAESTLAALVSARAQNGDRGATAAAATEALIELDRLAAGDGRAVSSALELLNNDSDDVVRYHALRYLREYADRPAVAAAVVRARDAENILLAVEARLIADEKKLR